MSVRLRATNVCERAAFWRSSWVCALLVLGVATACGPQVGDTCTQNTECGAGLKCDLATAGGYCTQTPCRAGECPDGASCIDFGTETTWCMMSCTDGVACNEGHVCLAAAASPTSKGAPKCLDGECKYCGIAPSD